VADQRPGDSIRQVSNLLFDFSGDTYQTPAEHKLRIHLEPAMPPAPNGPPKTLFGEENEYLRKKRDETAAAADPSLEFMRQQLLYYQPQEQERAYETFRLETAIPNGDVHIYEGYWADLSRLSVTMLNFFGEAYQLLLHLPSLGRTAVDYNGLVAGWPRSWRVFSFMQRWAVRWLTLFIATWSLDLASFILPAIVSAFERSSAALAMIMAALLIVCIAVVGAVGWLMQRSRDLPFWLWTGAPIVAAIATTLTVRPIASMQFVAVVAWLLGAAIIGIVLKAYDRRRPGALVIGGAGLLFALAALSWRLSQAGSIAEATWQAFLILNDGCRWLWILHFPWAVLTMFAGVTCVWMSRGEARTQARHTAWTARLTLSLATLLFANLNIAIWSALLIVLEKLLPFGDFANALLKRSAATGFVTITIAFALFCAIFIWSIFPSVIAEMKPKATQAADDRRMVALGRWLTRGLDLIPLGGNLLALTFVVIIGVWIAELRGSSTLLQIMGIDPLRAARAVGALLLVLISARFWLPGAASALDVMLDVDNYLREHPRTSTPRARIAERMTSLLRFLADEQYETVVIIAHSQGSVIVADLLRFLAVFDRELIARFEGKLRLFSMGCPLRQLYGRAFPGLYQWMYPPALAPDPAALHLVRWVNDYRSGDYVGRWIWRGENDPNVWRRRDIDPQNVATPTPYSSGPREESSIGEGAHTHYWDWSASDIGQRLGSLVRESMR